ncbi:hypothetical protein LSTR_LSTR013454 [Laodelphax striatellus]|uniref:Uncharacterized protein n=1 Tax=Laodelphax striatellus TaxID=195883 RepID=A0A482XND1_LAOST|nr:hypothetical protein LSTR_LSTR013454 [Laodelphax striatellus]
MQLAQALSQKETLNYNDLAQALLQKETLNYADVEKIIGPPPHDNKRFIENIDFDVPSSPTAEPAANGPETQQNSKDQADSQKH